MEWSQRGAIFLLVNEIIPFSISKNSNRVRNKSDKTEVEGESWEWGKLSEIEAAFIKWSVCKIEIF